jgi:hypothetical protein
LLLRVKRNSVNRICDGILASMSTPARPSLRGWRMIPESPPFESTDQIEAAFRSLRLQDSYGLARDGWSVVYKYGHNLPDEVVV